MRSTGVWNIILPEDVSNRLNDHGFGHGGFIWGLSFYLFGLTTKEIKDISKRLKLSKQETKELLLLTTTKEGGMDNADCICLCRELEDHDLNLETARTMWNRLTLGSGDRICFKYGLGSGLIDALNDIPFAELMKDVKPSPVYGEVKRYLQRAVLNEHIYISTLGSGKELAKYVEVITMSKADLANILTGEDHILRELAEIRLHHEKISIKSKESK